MSYLSRKQLFDEIIDDGLKTLNLSMGIVSRIENDSYTILAVKSETNVFVAGETFALQDTFCRDVYLSEKPLALVNLDEDRSLMAHPLYQTLPLQAYISAPIYENNAVCGTLNFSSMRQRQSTFSKSDLDYIEAQAQRISDYCDQIQTK